MMKIYAIRDRLIDYLQHPFFGPDDKNVLASVARLVNQGEITSDIAQAPHQFEVWSLGHVTQDGHVVAERTYIADCSSLVRVGIRGAGQPPGPGPQETAPEGRGGPPGAGRPGRAPASALSAQTQAEEGTASEVRRATAGGYPPRGDS